ncbi:endonuclease [Colwellia sp. MT41]|uniref:endonuclease/exonuclease/phosphatase family protein n=1 Tax=Colwellia sp. MT41 TaxID=58049 RepID=UPI00071792F9|nr:endonuclease/exonuclease/phosphatase family protein [Colwellia sp. MT41]ALO35188.1 endonuclease [Colwellia sp. MT41]
MKKHTIIALLALALPQMTFAQATTLKIATFNVSMEALNYIDHNRAEAESVSEKTLVNALASDHQQIKNIAEIIQRVNPDILLLNEFDYQDDNNKTLKIFIANYLNKGQQGQKAIDYPYFYQGPVNTGINSGLDLNGDGEKGKLPGDGFGYGHFPGHFGMALLSKYPIDIANIRSFQHFKRHDMPNALVPIDPVTNKPWYSNQVWQALRLSSKSHWDVPVEVNGKTIHILASHPTPPVFDGPEDRNGKRNHDEIRFWHDYITPEASDYIYDDNGKKGGLKAAKVFVILGDLNASSVDGEAINTSISALLQDKKIQDVMPQSQAGELHTPDNVNAKHHTSNWGMRVDYVLPSALDFTINDSGVFWPLASDESYRLIKDRNASSDHRLVWLELTTKPE